MISSGLYSTQNLYEAAYCLCRGLKLAGKQKNGNKTAIFFDGASAKEEALKYYNGGKVEAKAYSYLRCQSSTFDNSPRF